MKFLEEMPVQRFLSFASISFVIITIQGVLGYMWGILYGIALFHGLLVSTILEKEREKELFKRVEKRMQEEFI